MRELINKILEFLGIKNKYEQYVEPVEIVDISDAVLVTNKSYSTEHINYSGERITNMQFGRGNREINKESQEYKTIMNEAREKFQEELRRGFDLGEVQKAQQEIGRKYSLINDEHFSSMGKNANINIRNSTINGGTMDLDKVNITDSHLRNVRTYRGSEESTK